MNKTRFPPEPNGYLHIGHAKAIYINFNKGPCILRYDDTNPDTERTEFISSIYNDIIWLGYTPIKITYTSDYFDQLYTLAEKLIELDGAYVCFCDREKMKKYRFDRIECKCRNNTGSLELFRDMKNGKYKTGTMTLRMKCDMKSNNPNMRDHVAYRIKHMSHDRTHDKWCIYPSYDYSHCIVDSIEKITHSLCTTEFQTRNESYKWLLDTLGLYKPIQIEFSRLNIKGYNLSKRHIRKSIDDNIVTGWDDPRLLTISGIRRKGYTSNSIKLFCDNVGTKFGGSSSEVDKKKLESYLRSDLNIIARRLMMITDPIKIRVTNWSPCDPIKFKDYPYLKGESSTHDIRFTKFIYINRSDFRSVDHKKYYGLAPYKVVRLRYVGFIKCDKVIYKSNSDVIDMINVTHMKTYDKKIRGTLSWISAEENTKITIRDYDQDEFKEYIGITDTSIENLKVYDKVQFERIGYFSVDPDTKKNNIVLNSTVSLRESKNKN